MKLKITWLPFSFGIVALLLLRVYQMFFVSSAARSLTWETFQNYILIALCVVFAIILVFALLAKKSSFSKNVYHLPSFRKNIFAGIFAAISGILILADSFFKLLAYVNAKREITTLLISLFGALSSIVFILFAISFFTGQSVFNRLSALTIFPVMWAVLRLGVLFFQYYSGGAVKIFDMMDEVGLSFLVLFLFDYARVFAFMPCNALPKKLYIYGMAATLFLMFYATGNFLNPELNLENIQILSYITDLLISIFIIFALYSLDFSSKKVVENVVVIQETENNNEIPPVVNVTEESSEIKEESTTDITHIDKLVNQIKAENEI